MKFKIESTVLKQILDVVTRALPKGAVIIPSTAGVLIDVRGDGEGEVVFKATNLTLGAIVSTDMVDVIDEGVVLVDATKLVGMVGKFRGTITFNEKDGGEKVLCTAKGRRATLSTMNPDDYPEVEISAESNVVLTGESFVENVNRVVGFVADTETVLQGVNMKFGSKLTLTAIDGFALGRMVVQPVESSEGEWEDEGEGEEIKEINVIGKQLVEAARAVEKCKAVEVGVSKKKLYITGLLRGENADGEDEEGAIYISLVSLSLNGEFPPSVEDVITDGKEACMRGSMIVCSVDELMDAFVPTKQVEDTPFFTLEAVSNDEEETAIINCVDTNNSYAASIDVSELKNEGGKIGLNKKYMGIVLGNIEADSVILYITGERLLVVDGDVGDAYTQMIMGLNYDNN